MEYFIDSYDEVHASIDKVKYVIVGQGEDEVFLKQRVEKHLIKIILFSWDIALIFKILWRRWIILC